MFRSELPLGPSPPALSLDSFSPRVHQRCIQIPASLFEWATRKGIRTAGQLLAALESSPHQACHAVSWPSDRMDQTIESLKSLLEQW